MIERKQTPFEKAGYTKDTKFKCLVSYGKFNKGDVVTLHEDDGTMSPEFIDSEGNVHYMIIPTSDEAELEVLVEASIKVEPVIFPIGTEVKITESSQYYKCGADYNPINTKGKIVRNHSPYGDDFIYQVEWSTGGFNSYRLNDLVLWEEPLTEDNPWIEWDGGENAPTNLPAHAEFKFRNGEIELSEAPYYYRWEHYNGRDIIAYREYRPSVASQEAIVDVSNSKPSVGIDSYDNGYKESTEPLVSITKEVKYTVTIKGVEFTFTQDEINELTTELGAFEDYE